MYTAENQNHCSKLLKSKWRFLNTKNRNVMFNCDSLAAKRFNYNCPFQFEMTRFFLYVTNNYKSSR